MSDIWPVALEQKPRFYHTWVVMLANPHAISNGNVRCDRVVHIPYVTGLGNTVPVTSTWGNWLKVTVGMRKCGIIVRQSRRCASFYWEAVELSSGEHNLVGNPRRRVLQLNTMMLTQITKKTYTKIEQEILSITFTCITKLRLCLQALHALIYGMGSYIYA